MIVYGYKMLSDMNTIDNSIKFNYITFLTASKNSIGLSTFCTMLAQTHL